MFYPLATARAADVFLDHGPRGCYAALIGPIVVIMLWVFRPFLWLYFYMNDSRFM